MVDIKTETKPQSKPVNPRTAIREGRQRRLRLVRNGDRPATVKVWAANEDMREVLRHANGIRFRDTLDQGVEWPNDSFTARRIADGSVRTDGPASGGDQAEVDESLNPRQQAAARKPKSAEQKSEPKSRRQPEPPPPAA